MKDKNSNLVANKLVKAFLKNKIINPISSKYTKKLLNADKFRKLCESKIKKPIIGFKAGGTGIPVIKKLKEKIDYLSEKLRLYDIIDKLTGELSSGQKNRVSLAKSIINNPKILLLDEPTASLDPETGDFIRSFLEEYQQEGKTSILLASHNMTEVERLCSSVLMMNKGQIIDEGKPNELIKKHGRRNMEEVFLKLTREKV